MQGISISGIIILGLCWLGSLYFVMTVFETSDPSERVLDAAEKLAEASEQLSTQKVDFQARERAIRLLAFCLAALIPPIIGLLLLRYVAIGNDALTRPQEMSTRALVPATDQDDRLPEAVD